MINENLVKNWEYVKKNFDSLLKIYRNKYVLVYKECVVGSFDTYAAAAHEGFDKFGRKSGFLVQEITEVKPVNIRITTVPPNYIANSKATL